MSTPKDATVATRAGRMRAALHELWDLEDELGIEREGYGDAPMLTDHQQLMLAKAAWESDPRRAPFDDAPGSALMDVMRDAFAALRAYEALR